MKKICKNKKGFTLVEMVLVIAIIAIIAVVIFKEVDSYLQRAYRATGVMNDYYIRTEEVVGMIPNV